MFTVDDFIDSAIGVEKLTTEELNTLVNKVLEHFKLRVMNVCIGNKKPIDLYIPFRQVYKWEDIIEMIVYLPVLIKNELWVFPSDSRLHSEVLNIVMSVLEELRVNIKQDEEVSFYYFIQGD